MGVEIRRNHERKEQKLQARQRLRMRRFALAVATYAVVTLMTFLATRLGLGRMNLPQWTLFIGFALAGNGFFYALFRTGWNLRFPEPSLTQAQIMFSGLWGMISLYFLPAARPILLMFYVPAFSFGMLRLTRRQYLVAAFFVMGCYACLLLVEFLAGRVGFSAQYEMFMFLIFGILLIWFSFFGGFISNMRRRLFQRNAELRMALKALEAEIEERKRAEGEKDKLIGELRDAFAEIKTLSGLLPICASCKKIRNDQGYWQQIESYIDEHADVQFSHGICPECARKLYPDLEVPDSSRA